MSSKKSSTPKVTTVEYKRMLAAQNGCCAICGERYCRKRFAIDHDHTTGRIRGLLCPACNLGLGHFGDDPELLVSAATYLREAATGTGITRFDRKLLPLDPTIKDAAHRIASAEHETLNRRAHHIQRDPERYRAWAIDAIDGKAPYLLRTLHSIVRVVHPTASCASLVSLMLDAARERLLGSSDLGSLVAAWYEQRKLFLGKIIKAEIGAMGIAS